MRQEITWTRKPAIFASGLALLGLLLLATATARAEPSGSKEYELKAAFLYNFTKFVVWPPARLPTPVSPIIIGIYGRSPFGTQIDEAIRSRKVDGREIVLRQVSAPEQVPGIHLLFIPASEDRNLKLIGQVTRECSVLTVGETDIFQNEGGIITFVVTGEKLRFVIDMDAADRAGLKVSAQLQKLAHRVRRGP